MQTLLNHLLIIKNPQCWFDGRVLSDEIKGPEKAATEALILDEIDDLIQEIPPVWWPWK